jgi:hypothetical protein
MSQKKSVRKRIANDKKLLIEQLKKTPIVSLACEKIATSRATYYRWRKDDRRFKDNADAAIAHGVLLVNDMAESQLLSSIRDGNMTGLIFWLKHHHPSYETRIELRHNVAGSDESLTRKQKQAADKALEFFNLNKNLITKGDEDKNE